MKKVVLKTGIVISVLIVLILVFLPMGIKSYAIKNSKELVGRQIDFDKLNLNYFTGNIRLTDFKMFEPDDVTEFVSFDTLNINIEPYRYINNEKVIEQFYLQGLSIHTTQKDSIFNFDDLIAFHIADVDTVEVDEEPFKYFLNNLELKDANFIHHDKNIDNITHIEDFSFFIPFIGWNQEDKSSADLKFNFKNGGYFESKLNVNPVDGEYDAQINIKDLYLDGFYKNVREYAKINSIDGKFNGVVHIKGNTNEVENSIISGDVSINDFSMTDFSDQKFLAANKVECKLKTIDYANSSYVIDNLTLTKPYSYFQLDSLSNNMFRIFKIEEEEISESSDTKHTMHYAINKFKINNGVLDYTDNLTGEKFDYHLSQIAVDADKIVSDAKWVDIYSDMLLNERGTLNAKIGFNPADYYNAEINITIENFLLSDINIYSNHYTGHNVLEGDFYYNTKSKITDGNIVSENKLLVKNVSVSNTEKGLYKLPLKFALFLLKDKNGDVNLDVPVRGDLNDPSVKVGKIIWTTFKNLIVKAVASPVKLLAGLVDGDPKELEEITFTYTDTITTGKPQRQLDKIIDLESKKTRA